ncbi:nitrogen fixation protein NifZ [Methylocystis heyeri]|uniref:Nitrogen fixation protein NifZ n=1 Tax=Methylocystis heyeri TaxID=391905 RepID=A0A6B8KJG1_9HYPH|nr:nitrogen fixation protein NifZ [Methylocystis heyeri]QGM47767.1 nitrogen fixation protein NifZ [Methylocystis heyeri]
MSDDARPKFDWGRRVKAAVDLFNDGSYPELEPDALLVKAGDAGEVVNIGAHVESETTIYLVEFNEKIVVGCLEDEIEPV